MTTDSQFLGTKGDFATPMFDPTEQTSRRTNAQRRMDEGFAETLEAITTMAGLVGTVTDNAVSVGVVLSPAEVKKVGWILAGWLEDVKREQEARG